MQPVDLIGGYYRDSSIPQSRQDTVNWIPEVAQAAGTRTQWKLRGAPGLDFLLDIPGGGPIRGAENVEGQLFVVSGQKLCEIGPTGTVTDRGTIPGVGPVYMAHNQRSTGSELLIENGSSSGYVWNTATGTFTTITDEAHVGAISADYLDSFFILAEPFGRFWYHSDLATGLAYNSLDRYESEASPDRIVCARVNQFEVVVFNETTVEFFGNTGAATNTFQSKRIVIEVGCAGRGTVARVAGTLAWLGNDGQFYALANYQAVPISTDAEVKAIKGLNWSQAFATVFKDDSHEIAYWTFPDGQTFGYDFSTKLWHRRESYGLDRWRLNTLTYWNGKWVGGDFQRGRLYVLNWNTYTENGQPLVAERVTGPLHSDQSRFSVNYAELIFDTGTAAFGVEHEALLSYADDSGHNFKNWKSRSLGERGQYGKRVRYHQLGQTLNRVWRIRVASNGKRDLLGAVLQAEGASR